jgi:hypothetical protein
MPSGLFSLFPDDRSNLALGPQPPPQDTLLHQAQRAMDTARNAAATHSSGGDQLSEVPIPASGRQDDNSSPLPYPPTPRPYEALRANQAADDEEQITNIVFNETRALSGSGINEARKKMALTIMNAVERWPGSGNARFKNASTAPNTLPEYLPPKEEAILEDVRAAVREAGILRILGAMRLMARRITIFQSSNKTTSHLSKPPRGAVA